MQKRITWIELAKGIGIILVILGHMNINPFIRKIIFSFHMPLFFFISGVLYNGSKYSNITPLLKRRSKRLLIPYVSFSLLIIVSFWGLSSASLYDGIISIIKGQGGPSPMWFVACLWLTEIIAYYILKLSKKYLIIVLTSLFIIGYVLSYYKIKVLFNLDICCTALFFYCIGYLYRNKLDKLFSAKVNYITLLITPIVNLISVYLFSQSYSHHVDMFDNHIGNPILFLSGSISGIFFIIEFSKLLHSNRILSFFGQNTLLILGLHVIIPAFLNVYLLPVLNELLSSPFIAKNTTRILSLFSLILLIFLINNIEQRVKIKRTNTY